MSDKPEASDVQKRPPNNNILFAVIILIVVACAAAFVLLTPSDEQETRTEVEPAVKEQPMMELKPENDPVVDAPSVMPEKPAELEVPVQSPSEPEPEVEPLPTLNESDAVVVAKMDEYLSDSVMSLMVTDDVIRRGVVFVDNLAKGKVAKKHTPVVQPEEKFSVNEGDILTINPNSYERYTPYVKIFTSMSAAQAVRMYEEYKPLINNAYSEIGYGDDEFNQTLTDAIDLLLDTPEPEGDLPLLRDSVTYQYAFSEWEQLPAAQKQLLRMGPENMKKVKAALRNIKAQLENN
ncbi:DUF3014 domain-containing protein [Pseudoalteromonas sp. B28]|jgi:hypothetical protein|uniref:DUF3014 domain-containing protein n=1 Tax=Pseudoalteromonas TaxID=53246 RepID=UPI0016011C75|nr:MULTISPECIES: DUF3014 domain-containing protein [unclassified Pseudoalteromonas]MBB1276549.1 DUF3014 domain-containing protein [Pseudoalteromonas sp. SR43-3]MBB1443296.1 DUF3014 domain-containing protein [Pseudoalteromonas sp. SG43-3]MBB1456339.1 DUF3014 domain-containing protein [Pseudoalteromonas sp. SG43-5]